MMKTKTLEKIVTYTKYLRKYFLSFEIISILLKKTVRLCRLIKTKPFYIFETLSDISKII